MVPLRSHASTTSSRIASGLHTEYDQTHVEPSVHLATGGRELYTMIVVYNGDGGIIRTFRHQSLQGRTEFGAFATVCCAASDVLRFPLHGKVNNNMHTNPLEKKTANGIKRRVKDAHLHFEHYLDVLRNFHTYLCRQNLIKSTLHTVRTVHMCKVGLTAHDTKR